MPVSRFALLLSGAMTIGGCAPSNDAAFTPPADATVSAGAWARISDGMDAFLEEVEALESYPPGAAVIVVTNDGRRYLRVHGETKAGSGNAATADSVFYIASMTKAYVGLLAARLDFEGVLPLDTSLAEIWPGLELPAGRQAEKVMLRDLLVHSTPIEAREITFLEAYVRDVAPSEYPALLERYAVARKKGFRYDNLGYNVYAAALEARTGKNWRDWLTESVFAPLGMTATSGRSSGYGADEIAWSHQLARSLEDAWPRAEGWYLIPPKTDGMMQSAGGLMTSANDMAVWLEANLEGEGPPGSGLTREVFAKARRDRVEQPADGHGFSCDGYVYGWGVCELIVDGEEDAAGEDWVIGPFFQHGGGYVGVRSLMTFSPELGFGVAFLSNSDSMTGFLGMEVSKLAVELYADVPGGAVRSARRIATYRERNASHFAGLQDRLAEARADRRWRGWRWSPDAVALSVFVGAYQRPGALLQDASVVLSEGVLYLASSERRYRLTPAAPDLFGAQSSPYDEIQEVEFVRGLGGTVIALDWEGERYARQRARPPTG